MLGENLKNARTAKGLSQEELATRLNVVRQTISKWEKGLSIPDADLLLRLSEILEVSVSDLLGSKLEFSEGDKHDLIAQKLEQLNILLAEKNARSRLTRKIVVGVIIGILVLSFIFTLAGIFTFQAPPKVDSGVSTIIGQEQQIE